MQRQYSIAEARDHLPGLVHEVEQHGPVELTRRGKPVAVVLSWREYQLLTKPNTSKESWWDSVQRWRREFNPEELWADGDPFEGVRDRSPGRDVHFE